MITLIGRRNFECSISSRCACQKVRMYCGSAVRFFARTWRTRKVAFRPRMRSDPAKAIHFIFIPWSYRNRALLFEKLKVVELAVDAAPRQQLLVRPDFRDLAGIEDHDLVGAADGREAVRD